LGLVWRANHSGEDSPLAGLTEAQQPRTNWSGVVVLMAPRVSQVSQVSQVSSVMLAQDTDLAMRRDL